RGESKDRLALASRGLAQDEWFCLFGGGLRAVALLVLLARAARARIVAADLRLFALDRLSIGGLAVGAPLRCRVGLLFGLGCFFLELLRDLGRLYELGWVPHVSEQRLLLLALDRAHLEEEVGHLVGDVLPHLLEELVALLLVGDLQIELR